MSEISNLASTINDHVILVQETAAKMTKQVTSLKRKFDMIGALSDSLDATLDSDKEVL